MKKHPCVIQIGFAGARNLYEGLDLSKEERDPDSLVLNELKQILEKDGYIWNKLGLQDHHFFSGVSQMAIGGDFLFSRACGEVINKIPHQVVLPLHRKGFLNDRSESDDSPDFSDEQKKQAVNLLDSCHVISELCVAGSSSRHDRFEEVNLHILRVSSIIIGIYPETKIGRSGGTRELMQAAKRQGRYVVELVLSSEDGKLRTSGPKWFQSKLNIKSDNRLSLNSGIKEGKLNGTKKYSRLFPHLINLESAAASAKTGASDSSKSKKDKFERAARLILVAHVLATVMATAGLVIKYCSPLDSWMSYPKIIMSLLIAEIILLLRGYYVHHQLHKELVTAEWSQNRVIAELCRSILRGASKTKSKLNYLFELPFDSSLRSLNRTFYVLNLIRLKEANQNAFNSNTAQEYVKTRLLEPTPKKSPKGQIPYHESREKKNKRTFNVYSKLFQILTLFAITAVFAKLLLKVFHVESPSWIFSGIAILFPVIAVAILSWAHILDSEGRHQSHEQTKEMAEVMAERIRNAESEMEFIQLVDITERRLLMETLEWESRTKNKGVA